MSGKESGNFIGSEDSIRLLKKRLGSGEYMEWAKNNVILYRLAEKFGAEIVNWPFDRIVAMIQIMGEEGKLHGNKPEKVGGKTNKVNRDPRLRRYGK